MADAKVILVLIDALGFQAASDRCGYLGHLTEYGQCAKYRVKGELPAVSRPMYETVMTGLPVYRHGITTNAYMGASRFPNIFSLCKQHGLKTAAAAYMWMAELYNGTPAYDVRFDRFQIHRGGQIDYGIFYCEDAYPDTHLYADGYYLSQAYQPDFLLIHPMGVDFAGHQAGSDSFAYQHAVENSMKALAFYLPIWRQQGYSVVITADHGMDGLGIHCGDTAIQREVPLFILSERVKAGDFSDGMISQLNVAPLVCMLLGIPPGPEMIDPQKHIGVIGT